jgi:hypothetical protein
MNTLPRALTAHFFPDAATYLRLRTHWRALMNSDRKRNLAAEHHLLYLALLGKDWRAGFTPITNQRKLDNGAFHGWRLFRALWLLHNPLDEGRLLAPFEGTVSSDMLDRVRHTLPRPNSYAYRAADFTTTAFPFDAYILSDAVPLSAAR